MRTILYLAYLCFSVLVIKPSYSDVSYISFPSDVDWIRRDSDHFSALYRRGQDKLAIRALKAAERANTLLSPIFPEGPKKTWLVLADFQDSLNGYSLNLPYPHIVIFAAPPDASGTLSALDSWLESVILHEYVHTLQIYPASGLWKIARTIFGSWVLPNGLMPSHFHEGLAVELETALNQQGRGNGAAFGMYRRMAVEANLWGTTDFFSTDQMDGGILRWPHGTTPYFFGYHLMHELHDRGGDQGIYDFTDLYSSNWPFLHYIPLKDVYHTNYQSLWRDIFNKNELKAKEELNQIKSTPLSALKAITTDQESKSDLTLSPDGTLLAYYRWTPSKGSAIDILSIKESKIIDSIDTTGSLGEGLCWGRYQDKEVLAFIEPVTSHGYSLNQLKVWDFSQKKKSTVSGSNFELTHLHSLACSNNLDEILIYQETSEKGRIIGLSLSGNISALTAKVTKEWPIPEGTWASSLLITGQTSFITLRRGVNTDFYLWTPESLPKLVVQMKGHVYGLKKAQNEIWAISSVDRRDEIWSIDPNKKTMIKKVAVLGGINSFAPQSKSTAYILNYTHGGYDVAEASTTITKSQSLPDPEKVTSIQGKDITISEGSAYSSLSTIAPRGWIPNILVVPDGMQFGAWIPGFDISQRHVYNLFGGYDWRGSQGSFFANADYWYRFGKIYQLSANIYSSPSYLTSKKLFLKQWGGSLDLSAQFDWFAPKVSLGIVYKSIAPILNFPWAQSVGLEASISYSFGIKKRPISISPVKGTTIGLTHMQFLKFLGSHDNYFSNSISIDQYIESPWANEHVFYIGSNLGYTDGTSLLNSYFTGGGEVMFSQGRGTFLNRGFYPQTFLGRRIANFNFEYRFPIKRIERGWGYFPLKLKVLHGAIVADATSVDLGPSTNNSAVTFLRKFYSSVGAEIKSDWIFGSYMPSQFRIGGYHGFGPYGENLYVVFGLEASL